MSNDPSNGRPGGGKSEHHRERVEQAGAREEASSMVDSVENLEGPMWGRGADGGDERRFLEGPDTRTAELFRALRIFREYIRGFRKLHFVGPCVTVFGSARFGERPEVGRGRRFYSAGPPAVASPAVSGRCSVQPTQRPSRNSTRTLAPEASVQR